jgi:deoxyribodipyrimidine photo-lyase
MRDAPGSAARPAVMWFRRDLRLADNPALLAACAAAGAAGVLPVFCLDPTLWRAAGPSRRDHLVRSLRALDESLSGLGGRLVLLDGDPAGEVTRAARAVGAGSVHVAADHGPYGATRDRRVEEALAEHGIALQRTGSSYAVAPGSVLNGAGRGYQVFTPFRRAWAEHGWPPPAAEPTHRDWLRLPGARLPSVDLPEGLRLPEAGEHAARVRWAAFLDRLDDYDTARDLPAVDGTSRMSVHLKWGEIHPRTLLAGLGPRRSAGAAAYRTELAWREFYADVLWRRPETAREYYRPAFAAMEYDEPGAAFAAWARGRTGYPIVDAGMRQLRATGWMHNRVRMVAASFLVKDLHVEWRHGARHFMRWLVDGDLASNQHGWQWVAGCGTDAAPYFQVLNPVTQGSRFDAAGDYVRRWVPEVAEVPTRYVHHPADDPDGPPEGYPAPVVDHAAERQEALARLGRIKE